MKYLLDTCTFLWFISGDEKISPVAAELIKNPENEIFLSVISNWECILKKNLGLSALPQPLSQSLQERRERHGILSLPLDETSLAHLSKLPWHHKDPFDRMLICQALEHSLSIVTPDVLISQYPVKTVW